MANLAECLGSVWDAVETSGVLETVPQQATKPQWKIGRDE
jgi:hypothetical protein